jgi:hypothetical protein
VLTYFDLCRSSKKILHLCGPKANRLTLRGWIAKMDIVRILMSLLPSSLVTIVASFEEDIILPAVLSHMVQLSKNKCIQLSLSPELTFSVLSLSGRRKKTSSRLLLVVRVKKRESIRWSTRDQRKFLEFSSSQASANDLWYNVKQRGVIRWFDTKPTFSSWLDSVVIPQIQVALRCFCFGFPNRTIYFT